MMKSNFHYFKNIILTYSIILKIKSEQMGWQAMDGSNVKKKKKIEMICITNTQL